MNQRNGKVVPFERPADYWAHRARRHRSLDRSPDKARLLRKALEKSGDPQMALELSALYLSMDCYTAAERYLLRAAVTGGLTGELCYLMGCCALNRGAEELGEAALDASLRLDPDGPYAEQAQDVLETYPWSWEKPLPGRARAEVYCRRARRALLWGRREEALLLARKSWRRGKTRDCAYLLGTLLPPVQGIPYLKAGLRMGPDRPAGHFFLAVAYFQQGKPRRARAEMERAYPLCDTLGAVQHFLDAAERAGCLDMALRLVDEKLQRIPLSADCLRLKYLCLRRMGRDEQARRILETLLEIDPDDAAALWYRRHPEKATAAPDVILPALGGMVYALPGRLRAGPLNRALHQLTMMLAGWVDMPLIYQAVPFLWKHLTPAQKRACDERRRPAVLGALAVYLLLAADQAQHAASLIFATPGRKRILRLVKRMILWSEEETSDALHQF